VAIKLINQIRNWLETEANQKHPGLKINEFKPIPKGYYYDLQLNNFKFRLILQNLKKETKINWLFHRNLLEDEIDYWKGKYYFKLLNEESYMQSKLQIGDVKNEEPIKVFMSRPANTLRIFTKDLKWITVMEQEGERAK
jgi:hypothetical protein